LLNFTQDCSEHYRANQDNRKAANSHHEDGAGAASNEERENMADFTPPAHNTSSPFADMRGHHVAVRTPDLETAKRWYVEKLDFRVVAEWDYADEKLAYLAPATDDHFYIEILGGDELSPQDVRPYTDLGDSLKWAGYHLHEREKRRRDCRGAALAGRHHRH
jgi:Glyoxalase/Bleomycin resistance protein/Dioxygenase superfamily